MPSISEVRIGRKSKRNMNIYYYDGGDKVRKVPDYWSPFDPEPELTEQEIVEMKKLYTEVNWDNLLV